MSVRIIEGTDGYKAIYDSVTMTAFGPIFNEDDDVEAFLEWLPIDARKLEQRELNDKVYEWRKWMEDHGDDVVSDCCGAEPRGNGDNDSKDYGICPDCGDHCEYVKRSSISV